MRVSIGNGVRLFFDVDGARLTTDGTSLREKPTMLLLHGGPGADHTVFKPWWSQFADTHQVVYLDHRGHGRSDGWDAPETWRLDTWSDDVVRFCDALEIEDPVVVGNSFGGVVAMHYASRYPSHPSKLVLSSAPARFDLDETAAAFERLGGRRAGALARRFWTDETDAVLDDYLLTCVPLYNRHPDPTGTHPLALANPEALAHWISGEHKALNLLSELGEIRCPTLVLAGADDPVAPSPTQSQMIAHLRPELVTFHMIPDCGHGTYRDQPEITREALRSFLDD